MKQKFLATETQRTLHPKRSVDCLCTTLLSYLPIIARVLVIRLEPVTMNLEPDIRKRFPKLFQELGKREGEYHIKFITFVLSTSGRVSPVLLPRLKAEISCIDQMGVISRIDIPPEWCASMVVVPKPIDKAWICVDLTKLSENICRKQQVLPCVEHNLGQLTETVS